jgi:uncharacterized protein YcbX
MAAWVSSLHIYPLKSARGIAVDALELDALGPRGDRRWMLVDSDARFLSQRDHPRLALLDVALVGDGIVVRRTDAPPLDLSMARVQGRIEATIWDDTCEVDTYDAAADRWFSDALSTSCRVVHLPDNATRRVNPKYVPGHRRVSLADAFPLLVISEGSLVSLNARLRHPVSMNRFRPNVVVAGTEPHAEDAWNEITIGGVACSVVKPCARCATIQVDQATATRGREPLATLATYRSRDGKVLFGQNAIHATPGGTIRVGDPVSVLELRDANRTGERTAASARAP